MKKICKVALGTVKLVWAGMKGIFVKYGEEWNQLSQTVDTVIDFAHTYINPEPKDDNPYALKLASQGSQYNHRIKTEAVLSKDASDIISYVTNNTVGVPLILYRSMSFETLKEMMCNADKDCDLCEKGFLFTALVRGHEEQGHKIRLRIYAPAGVQAVYSGFIYEKVERKEDIDEHYPYFEVILQPGIKLKICSIDNGYINCVVV